MPYLSLIIPLYNEKYCLLTNLKSLKGYLESLKKDCEIILVNDGSTDSTASVIDEILDSTPQASSFNCRKYKGKGHALKRGILNATGKYIVYTDADLAVPVNFIGKSLKKLESGISIVIGSRHLPDSSLKVREDPIRQFLGKCLDGLPDLTSV